MIAAVIALLAAVPAFFLGIYASSRSGAWGAIAWSLLAVLSLVVVGISVLWLMVPGFFAGLL